LVGDGSDEVDDCVQDDPPLRSELIQYLSGGPSRYASLQQPN
jgi:hypothetical protein